MIVDLIFVLGVLQVLLRPVQVKCQLSGDPENFPWNAFIETDYRWSNGVLISPDYVVLPANSVNGSSTVTVYLGCQNHPYFEASCHDNNTQVIKSTQMLFHEDFKKVASSSFGYQNNIALIKLAAPAKWTHTVQPGILARDASQLVEGQLLNLPAYTHLSPYNLTLVNASFANDKSCVDIFGKNDLKDQQFCLKFDQGSFSEGYFTRIGASISVGNAIVGFLTKAPLFDPHCVALNVVPYINWISRKTNIDKAILTADCQPLAMTRTS